MNATTVSLDLHRSFIDSSMRAPSMAIALPYPARSRLITSALPSTSMIHGDECMSELHVSFDLPYVWSLPAATSWTSLSIVSPSLIVLVAHLRRISFARFTMSSFLAALTSSIASSLNEQSNGPTLSMLSMAAAMRADVSMSVLMGMRTSPDVVLDVVRALTSMRPIFETRCSSLRFISGPSRPSVCPKIAPMRSARSTRPSTLYDSLT